MITSKDVRDQLLAYLNHNITLSQLVDWAENAMNEGILEERNPELLRDIIARIGLADVKQFSLSWDDCYDFLSRLGYHVKVLAA
jgi:hypothetical protein